MSARESGRLGKEDPVGLETCSTLYTLCIEITGTHYTAIATRDRAAGADNMEVFLVNGILPHPDGVMQNILPEYNPLPPRNRSPGTSQPPSLLPQFLVWRCDSIRLQSAGTGYRGVGNDEKESMRF